MAEEMKKGPGLSGIAGKMKAQTAPSIEPKKEDKPWYKSQVGKEAILAAAPTLIGAALGGARGGEIGAKAGQAGLAHLEKQKAQKRQESKEEAALGLKKTEAEAERRYKTKMLNLRQQEINLKRDAQLQKERGETSMSKRLANLGAEEKKRYDNVVMGKKAVNDMMGALGAGDDTYSLIGDNDFTFAKSRWNEALGRMQSGGAINKEERKEFANLVPTVMDSREIQAKKLKAMGELMDQRLGTMGFAPSEIPGFTMPGQEELMAGYTADKPTGLKSAQARRGYILKDPKQMTDEELMKELGE